MNGIGNSKKYFIWKRIDSNLTTQNVIITPDKFFEAMIKAFENDWHFCVCFESTDEFIEKCEKTQKI